MKKHFLVSLLLAVSLLIFVGCAVRQQTAPPFIAQRVDAAGHLPKVDHFLVLLDASSSMGMRHKGQPKFDIARGIVRHLTQTVPELDVTGGLRSFGHSSSISKEKTILLYGMTEYSGTAMSTALDAVDRAGGSSPMNLTLDAAVTDLKETTGDIAVILISDGEDLGDEPLLASQRLKGAYGERLCIYAIQVGDDPTGGELMKAIARTGGCSDAINADSLTTGPQMAAFATTVFIGDRMDSDGDGVTDAGDRCPDTPSAVVVDDNGCPMDFDEDGVPDHLDRCPGTTAGVEVDSFGCPMDADRDGVPNHLDQCPGTPVGTDVDSVGCLLGPATPIAEITAAGTWLYRDINFETNKWELTPSSYPSLNEITELLKSNPSLKVEIQGHTDDRGSRAYNLELSEKRAAAVKEHLTRHGVPSYQLTSKGYGPDRPIATNETADGRAKNRRVELKPIQ